MRRHLLGTATTVAVTAGAVAASLVAAPPAPAAAAQAPGAFSTSFEDGQPAPTWTDEVEVDAAGRLRAKGVAGPSATGWPGNVNERVASVDARGENPPNEVAANAADGDPATKWLDFAAPSPDAPVWLQYRTDEPVAVVRYALTSANDAPERDPVDWVLRGSTDGATWVDLDARTGEAFTARGQLREFAVEGAAAYTWFRLDVTRHGGGGIVQLADLQLSDGSAAPPPAETMRTRVGAGPASGYNIKPRVGFTGLHALQYGGTQEGRGRGFSYNRVLDVDVPVGPATRLSYKIFPELTDQDLDYPSTFAAVDLAFTDGSYLSDLGAVDNQGYRLDPRSQGASKSLYANQWNDKYADIGRVAAGKTVDRVLVAYDNPGGPSAFGGWVDDIEIDPAPEVNRSERLVDWVDTRRGSNSSSSYSRGNTFPATAVPHGFNFWTPQTSAGSLGTFYSYASQNNEENLPEVQAFAVSHEPSIWMGDRQTFQFLPQDGPAAGGQPVFDREERALAFSHDDEVAQAHYYGVTFQDGTRTEIAPTDHAAVTRFTFTGDSSSVLFDNVNDDGWTGINVEDGVVTGYSDTRSGLSNGATRMYLYATFDEAVTGGGKVTGHGRDDVTGYVSFDTSASKVVTMRMATSLLSVEQARRNLEMEVGDASFDEVRERGARAWEDVLDVVEVEGASEEQRTNLYSNLYRLSLWPNSAHENVGTPEAPVWKHAVQSSTTSPAPTGAEAERYRTETVAPVADGKVYVNNGFWDTFRTSWPAYSFLYPEKAGELVDGFVQQYRDGGWVSRWSAPGYANLMTGTSSDASFADAYVKGVRGFDAVDAYEAAVKNATVRPPGSATNSSVGRKGLETSIFLGYTPSTVSEGVSWALEGYLNDFAIGRMGQELAQSPDATPAQRERWTEESRYFLDRAQGYVHLFDPAVGFFQGKSPSGVWKSTPEEYDAEEWGHDHDYTETDGWNFAFHVPFDGQGLANLYGGRDGLADKLDAFFATPETALKPGSYGGTIHEMVEARDVRMGQWGFSNQVAHHIPWMYDYAGQPWKAQAITREALQRLYGGGRIGQGYPGDEDQGEPSAWNVFASLGFYPLQVGSPEYVVGSPQFTRMVVHREDGDLVVEAPRNSTQNVYVQGLQVDGQRWTKAYLPHDVLTGGTTLTFAMGPRPSRWGTAQDAAPRSLQQDDEVPTPLADTTGRGRGTATSSGLAGGVTAAALFDDTSATRTALAGPRPWVRHRLTGAAREVTHYTLTSSDQAADPSAWTLEGSNDGETWTTLDSRTGEAFPWRLQTRAFEVDRPGVYRDYRLAMVGAEGGTTALAEVELLADVPEVHGVAVALDRLVASGAVKRGPGRELQALVRTALEAEEDGDAAGVLRALRGLQARLDTLGPPQVSAAARAELSVLLSQWVTPADRLAVLRGRVADLAASGDVARGVARSLQEGIARAGERHAAGDAAGYERELTALRERVAGARPHQVSARAQEVLLPLVDGLLAARPPLDDLRAAYDTTAIGDDGAANADFDGEGWHYSRQALAEAGIVQGEDLEVPGTGMAYRLPDVGPGAADSIAAAGQVLDVSSLPAGTTRIAFVGAAHNGDVRSSVVLTYTDGTTATAPLAFGDWTLGGGGTTPRFDNVGLAQTAYRNRYAASPPAGDTGRPWLFATAPVQLAPGKVLATVTLPQQRNLKVLTLAHGTGTPAP
ncbi:GH92 family glycosyl hydrolase [Vallicoccus soli]|uniref:GH92 family glycosyl hydrolase n=1 Tax=Vallicoccus soli TaxID=2339232 RepID=UPI001C498489|nr:GH92 family glycosyl hydrolase [Vallicoccus soli]